MMWLMLAKRILWAIPTLFAVLCLTFFLTRLSPGDPVLAALGASEKFDRIDDELYRKTAHQMQLDLPVFYFSVNPRNVPFTVNTEMPHLQPFLRNLCSRSHSRQEAREFINLFQNVRSEIQTSKDPVASQMLERWISGYEMNTDEPVADVLLPLAELGGSLSERRRSAMAFVPSVRWWGSNNQFHIWLARALRLDFGLSSVNNQPVTRRILQALRWTLCLNLGVLLLAYLIAVPLGMTRALYRDSLYDRLSGVILNMLYAVPVFWLGTLLVVFFSTNEYGRWTNIFPAVGIWQSLPTDSFWQILGRNWGQLAIPVISIGTGMMAFISQQMRSSTIVELDKPYVWQLEAKGLTTSQILRRHVFRNASFPIITMLAIILPATIGGSLVMEVICNIPGMGRLMYDAIFNQDWNVVMLVVLLGAFLTICGLIISDLLYSWANPKIQTSG